MKHKLLLLLPLILGLILYSCTSSGSTGEEPAKIPIAQIKERVNYNSDLVKSLEASGTISIDSPELSNQASIDIKIRKPDSVLIEIDGPFGISIVKALIARDSFTYYNVQDNRVIYGPTSDINIGAILKMRLTFDELINSFSGSFYFPEIAEDTMEASSEQNLYVLNAKEGSFDKKYFIDPGTFLIKRYLITDNKDNILLDVTYDSYEHEVTNGMDLYFPNDIKLSRPDRRQSIWLHYSDKEINKSKITFRLRVPKSAKVTRWE